MLQLMLTAAFLLPTLSLQLPAALKCPKQYQHSGQQRQFHLVRECQRAATDQVLTLENISTFEECVQLAHEWRGLALNYAPIGRAASLNRFAMPYHTEDPVNASIYGRLNVERSKLSVFEQPGEFFNCHVLQCPQNSSFASMVNDSRFDYYSLFGRPVALHNYSCVPEVGLFMLYTEPSNYANASLACSNATEFSGSLAHVASEHRSRGLAQLLLELYKMNNEVAPVFLAFVGLHYNRSTALSPKDFRNEQRESLNCYLYRAWDVGHPRTGAILHNASCVAITPLATWQTLSCAHKLPYICEIFTPPPSIVNAQLDIGTNSLDKCGI